MNVVFIAVSQHKGTRKTPVSEGRLRAGFGLEGDAHAGPWHRQVSFLALEQIEAARQRGLKVDPGDFAENFTTLGIDWKKVPVGTRLRIGETAVVEITQIGKVCHHRCEVFRAAGDCIMPREGVFGSVLQGGRVAPGDPIRFLDGTGREPGSEGPPPDPGRPPGLLL